MQANVILGVPHPDLAVAPTAMRAGVEAELVDLEWMLNFVFELVEYLEAGDFASLESFLADKDAELSALGRAAANNPADMENIGLLREVIGGITAELDTISRSRSRAIDMANAPILHRLKYGVEIEFSVPEVSVSAPVARFGAAAPTVSVISTETKTLTYDAFNHLIRVEKDGMIATYTYRADSLRHSKTVNGATMTHVWNFGSIVLERNASGAVVNRFHRGLGHLISSEHHGFYLFNVRGDVVQRVDSAGNVIHAYVYDAFGNEQNKDSVNTNPFRFSGEYYDFETGFIYLRARFYNPVLGRFISEDPHWNIRNMQFGDRPAMRVNRAMPNSLAIMQAGNLYAYTINNPVMWTDPSGRIIELPSNPGQREIVIRHLQRLTNHTLGYFRPNPGAAPQLKIATWENQGTFDAMGGTWFTYGNALLQRMIESPYVVMISLTLEVSRFAPDPTGFIVGTVYFNPNTIYSTHTKHGAGLFTDIPPHIMLAHELIHGDRRMRGVNIHWVHTAAIPISGCFFTVHLNRNVRLEEWATIGLGHYTAQCITENMIRIEHGYDIRIGYVGSTRRAPRGSRYVW